MATILETESFDGVATIAQLAGAAANATDTKWSCSSNPASFWTIDATGGVIGQSLKMVTAGTLTNGLFRTLTAGTSFYEGIWYKPAAVTGTSYEVVLALALAAGSGVVAARVGSEVALVASGGSVLATSAGLGLVAGTYYAIELSAVLVSGTNWALILRVNGTVKLSTVSTNLAVATMDRAYIGSGNSAFGGTLTSLEANGELDGFYIASNAFVTGGGSWRIQAIRPSAAGAHTDGVPDSGSNYARVNEQNVSDASYVQFTNDNDTDTYEQDNPTHISGHSVRAINRCTRAAYLAGAKHLVHVIRDGSATELVGADKTLAASLGYVGTVFNKQADGTTDWGSFNDVDAYQLGYKQRA